MELKIRIGFFWFSNIKAEFNFSLNVISFWDYILVLKHLVECLKLDFPT